MISRPFVRRACAAALLLLAAAPSARAEDDATVEMARQRFREGVGYYDQRNYEKARLAFLQAFALKPHPSVLLNLAQSELRAGHPEDAAGHFSEYLRTNAEASEGEKQEAELGLAASKSKVGEVSIAVDSAGAQIFIDGVEKGSAPLPGPLYVPAGTHTIEARASERSAKRSIVVNAGQSLSVTLPVRGAAAVAAAPPKKAKPVEADDEPDEAPPVLEETPTSQGDEGGVSTDTEGRRPFFQWLFDTPLALVGAGVGVVGLGVGGTFAVLAKTDYDDANSLKSDIQHRWATDRAELVKAGFSDLVDQGPCVLPDDFDQRIKRPPGVAALAAPAKEYKTACSRFQDAADSGDSKRTIAIVGGVVGGLTLAGTIVYYFVDPDAEQSQAGRSGFRASLYPITGPGLAGLGVFGSF